ncbi:aspartic peptidase domain-containing protein [Microdochium bolleyi]|uniref:Aspartic peptidase domain-containing protein n=1 Tax=Microdochium bolleyi TaxID=196109 RepID=A0A136ITI1_9PEZI|nr:aspartic peptidase domain-containing protein [Microdochium bolleyi]
MPQADPAVNRTRHSTMASSSSSKILALAGALAGAAQMAEAGVPTVAMPVFMGYGYERRVATNIVLPYATIEATYDSGSSDFFLFENNSTMNWGCPYLSCQGQCNATVPADISYNPALSLTKTNVTAVDTIYGYGGGLSKMYLSDKRLTDTLTFGNTFGDTVTVPDVDFALAQYLQQRIRDTGSCSPVPTYSRAILGVAAYVHDPTGEAANTQGPSLRETLFQSGRIKARTQSLWLDKPRPGVLSGAQDLTGVGLLGGIDTSKYTGPLVRIPRTGGAYSVDQYYTYAPNITVNGVGAPLEMQFDYGGRGVNMSECLLDSGAGGEAFNPVDPQAFFNATGLRENPARGSGQGQNLAWPAPCDQIPADQFLEYNFVTAREGETAKVRIPMTLYHRYQDPQDTELGWCTMSILLYGCGMSRTFSAAVFFAADDDNNEMAIAQGGISEPGSPVDPASVVLRIP